jgi:hypothetical protein
VADDLTAEVTIQYPPTGETRTVMAGAVAGFTDEHGWVVVDAAGRRKAQQPTTPSKEI